MAYCVRMGTKQSPKQVPNGHRSGAWEPPRGISFFARADRPSKPYWVKWGSSVDGKGGRLGFPAERDREIFARDLASKLQRHGSAVLSFDPEEWRRWLEFRALVGPEVDPRDVAREWLDARRNLSLTAVGLTVAEAVTKYLGIRQAEHSWGADAYRHAKKHLERFSDALPGRRLNTITADDIRGWLGALPDAHPLTVKDHRKNVNTFLDRAVREGWIPRNPCDAVLPPKIIEDDVHVISARAAFEFFKANRDARCIGRVALEAFGGVRYTTAGKLSKENVLLDSPGIRMLGRHHKGGKTRFRQGQPDNLFLWLRHAPESCWAMTPLQYREEKRMAAIAGKLRPAALVSAEDKAQAERIKNIWRHSFASYHLAMFKTPTTTQYLMQHSSVRMTEVYEGVATEADARLYLAITPESVLQTWEEFVSRSPR